MLGDAEVAHGYTMRQLDTLARVAARTSFGNYPDYTARYDIAYSAIAEELCAADAWPSHRQLLNAASGAIRDERLALDHLRGVNRHAAWQGELTSPRFMKFWTVRGGNDPEDDYVEKVAVWQIVNALTARQRAAVLALATLDDYDAAAHHLNLSRGRFNAWLSEARREFRTYWYAPETAPPMKGRDARLTDRARRTHCAKGHEMVGENVRSLGRRKGQACRTCEHERSRERWLKQKAERKAAG